MCVQSSYKMDSNTIHRSVRVSTELLQLMKSGKYNDIVKEILGSLLFCPTADVSASLFLHYSARYNNTDLTRYLLSKGCDVNFQDSLGFTALMFALMENQEAVIRILLTAGADIFKLNYEGKSALKIVAKHHEMSDKTLELFFQELQRKCSSVEEVGKNLMDAGFHLPQVVVLKDTRVLEYMLTHGSPVNYADYKKTTALHRASKLNYWECVNLLLKHNADAKALDSSNSNPLFYLYAVNQEHSHEKIDILKAFISGGASMTTCASNGCFNAFYTLTQGNHEAVHTLFESGLDFNAKDEESGKNILHYLASNFNPGVADELKLHMNKFDVNVPDNFDQTPLIIAVMLGNINMVKFLLKQGARTDVKHNIYRTTPLYFAYKHSKSQHQQCGEMLFEYNADPQFVAVGKNGETLTIFDAALKKNDLDRIKPVIAHLVILEKRGTTITETTWDKINSHESLKEYFDRCRELLTEQISGRLMLFDLLNSDKKKIARYLNDEGIVEKIERTCSRLKILDCRYYCDILNKRHLEGDYYKKLKNKTARVIRKFFKNRIHKTHLVIDNIVNYLDDKSLRQMSRLYYHQMSNRQITITTISKNL